MERVRTRDNDSSPYPTENPTALSIQAYPCLPTPNRTEPDAEYPTRPSTSPFTMNPQDADKPRFFRFEPPRLKPLFRGFERPSLSRIAVLTTLCLITYPAFYILTLVATDKSLFVVRLIVSVWCSGVGFAIGYILLRVGARHLEAASEFTLAGIENF